MDKKAFSLIELILILALIVILSSIVLMDLANYRGYKNLEASLNEIVAVLRETQNKSIVQFGGKNWSVRFDGVNKNYEIFSGTSYQSNNVIKKYFLKTDMKFSEPFNQVFDLIFNPITGEVRNNKIISIYSTNVKEMIGDIIVKKTPALINSKIEKNIAAYWHFDENSGSSVYDASPNNNLGTLVNALQLDESFCKFGRCLKFDGTDRYVSVNNSPSLQLNGDLTIMLWLFPLNCSSPARQGLIYKSYNYEFELILESNCVVSFYHGDGNWEEIYEPSSFSVSTGSWNFIAISRESSNKKIYFYKNDSYLGSVDYTKTPVKSSLPVIIGKRDYTNYYFNGYLDEVRIYNRALSYQEIKDIYNLTK